MSVLALCLMAASALAYICGSLLGFVVFSSAFWATIIYMANQ